MTSAWLNVKEGANLQPIPPPITLKSISLISSSADTSPGSTQPLRPIIWNGRTSNACLHAHVSPLSKARAGCHMMHAATAAIALNQASASTHSIKPTQHRSIPSSYGPIDPSQHLVKCQSCITMADDNMCHWKHIRLRRPGEITVELELHATR